MTDRNRRFGTHAQWAAVCLTLLVGLVLLRNRPERLIPSTPNKAAAPAPAAVSAPSAQVPPPTAEVPSAPKREKASHVPGLLTRNEGQWDGRVKYCLNNRRSALFFTSSGFTLSLMKGDQGIAIRQEFVGGRAVEPEGEGEQEGKASFFVGDPSRWKSGLTTYSRLVYRGVWPGVDLLYDPRANGIEYTLVVHPGGEASAVRLAYQGVDGLAETVDGDLAVATALGTVSESRPIAFQGNTGVDCRFRLNGDGSYGFDVGEYDRSKPLLIDPTIGYSTLLGQDVQGMAMAMDSSGNVYLTGDSLSSTFPTTPGAFDTSVNVTGDVFVTKLNAGGATLGWSTFLGGTDGQTGYGVDVDADGNVYVTGYTSSADFPTTAGAYDTSLETGANAFVTKLNADGATLAWSTFLGGTTTSMPFTPPSDEGRCIAVDLSGNVYVGGKTNAVDFPATAGAFDTTFSLSPMSDLFVARLNAGGATLGWATYLGGPGPNQIEDIAVDLSGNVYLTGSGPVNIPTTEGAFDTTQNGVDTFVMKINAGGATLGWSTLLGGASEEYAGGLVVNATGDVYVVGGTSSSDFPTTPGAYDRILNTANEMNKDIFVTKVNAGGATLGWSTYLGGTGPVNGGGENGYSIAMDPSGNVYVTGFTHNSDFPTTPDAFDTTFNGTSTYADVIVAKLNATGTALVWSTFLGGSLNEIGEALAVDPAGNVTVAGCTTSSDFPRSAGAYDITFDADRNIFVTRIDGAVSGSSVPTYSYASESLAPATVNFQADFPGVVLYQWDFDYTGEFHADYSSPSTGSVVTTYSTAGNFTARLRVVYGNSTEATFDTLVVVTALEVPPTVSVTATPLSGTAPLTVLFTGPATPVRYFINAYMWDFDANGSDDFVSPTSPQATYTYRVPGTHICRLRVVDTGHTYSSEDVVITVNPAADPPVIGSVTATPSTAFAGDTVSFSATADAGAVGTITGYEWDFDGDGDFEYSSATSNSASNRYTEPGTYSASVRVTDSEGVATESETAVTIQIPSTIRVWWMQPQDGQTISGMMQMMLANTAPGTSTAKVEFYCRVSDGSPHPAPADPSWVKIGQSPAPPYSFFTTPWNTTGLTGAYDLLAVVTANDASTADSRAQGEVTVTIGPGGIFESATLRTMPVTPDEQVTSTTVNKVQVSLEHGSVESPTTLSIEQLPADPNPSQTGAQDLDLGYFQQISLGEGTLQKPADVGFHYRDENEDGLDDVTGVAGEDLRIYHYNATDGTWEELMDVTTDPAEGRVVGTTPGFSVFAIGGPATGVSVGGSIVGGGNAGGSSGTSGFGGCGLLGAEALCLLALVRLLRRSTAVRATGG